MSNNFVLEKNVFFIRNSNICTSNLLLKNNFDQQNEQQKVVAWSNTNEPFGYYYLKDSCQSEIKYGIANSAVRESIKINFERQI